MKFSEFLNQAWKDHASDSAAVATRIPDAFAMIEDSAQIAALAHLMTHVFGEHLGEYDRGIGLMESLSSHKFIAEDSRAAIARSIAALKLAGDDSALPSSFSLSDQARVLSMAAASRASHGDTAAAVRMFDSSVAIADGLPSDDPAQRALAITGNNLAVGFEEMTDRSPGQTDIMVRAAEIGLAKWKLAGNPVQIQTAHYRLAKSLLVAGRLVESLNFARACMQYGLEHSAGALDMFYAHEILARVQAALGSKGEMAKELMLARASFESLGDEDKKWVRPDFEKLEKI